MIIPPAAKDFCKVDRYVTETATGKFVNPLALNADDVDIYAIAHSLSQTCRFNGHCRKFYSNAEHCCAVMDIMERLSDQLQCGRAAMLEALLHDAAEPYLTDMPSPIKRRDEFSFFREAEERILATIRRRFGFAPTAEEIRWRELADEIATFWEAEQLMPSKGYLWNWSPEVTTLIADHALHLTVEGWSFEQARFEFLSRFIKWN